MGVCRLKYARRYEQVLRYNETAVCLRPLMFLTNRCMANPISRKIHPMGTLITWYGYRKGPMSI